MTPAKKPPGNKITVKLPPKKTSKGHHTPTENQYWNQFVKKYNLTTDQAGAVAVAASSAKLPKEYLAALIISQNRKGLMNNPTALGQYATKESSRIGTTANPNQDAIGLLPPKYAQSIHWKTLGTSSASTINQSNLTGSIKDPVLRDKKGNVIKDDWGSPITRNALLTEKLTYDDLFRQYVGRKMTTQEAVKFTKNHWSAHSIADQYLTKLPAFYKGKAFQNARDGFMAGPGGWESVYGVSNLKPPKDLIRQAMLRGSNGATWFADQIRKLPMYKQSVEYKKFSADFSQVYNQIIGQIGDDGKKLIDQSIMKRVSAEQFAADLRKQPGYANSLEQRNLVEQSATQAGIQLDYSQAVPTSTVAKPKPGAVTNSQEPQPLPPYRPNPPAQQPHNRPPGNRP